MIFVLRIQVCAKSFGPTLNVSSKAHNSASWYISKIRKTSNEALSGVVSFKQYLDMTA